MLKFKLGFEMMEQRETPSISPIDPGEAPPVPTNPAPANPAPPAPTPAPAPTQPADPLPPADW